MLEQPKKIAIAVVLLTLGAACQTPVALDDNGTGDVPHESLEEIGVHPFEDLELRFPAQVAFARRFLERLPPDLPEGALPSYRFVAADGFDEERLIVPRRSSGAVVGHYVFLSASPSVIQLHVLCLRNAEQVPCTPGTVGMKGRLQPRTGIAVPFEIEAQEEDRIDFLSLVEGDSERWYPASSTAWAFVDSEPEVRAESTVISEGPEMFGGCDVAAIVEGDHRRRDTYSIPGTKARHARINVVVEVCPEMEVDVVQLAAIVNRERVSVIDLGVWKEPTRLTGKTLVVPIPAPLPENVREFQVLALLHSREPKRALISHAVRFH